MSDKGGRSLLSMPEVQEKEEKKDQFSFAKVDPAEAAKPIIHGAGREVVIEEMLGEMKYDLSSAEQSLKMLRLSELMDNPYNPRTSYESIHYGERIRDLAASMAKEGQHQAILVTKRGDKYLVIDGKTRWLAAQHNRKTGESEPTIRAEIRHNVSDKDLYRIAYTANEERAPHTDVDRAISWEKVLAAKLYANAEELALELGVSTGRLSMTLAFNSLPAGARVVMSASPDKFTYNIFGELRSLNNATDGATLESFVNKITNEEMTLSMIKKLKAKAIEEFASNIDPVKLKKRARYSLMYCGERGDGLKVSAKEPSEGRLLLEISGVSNDDKQKISDFIKNLVESEFHTVKPLP